MLFIADHAASAIQRNPAALVEGRSEVLSRTLHPALHSRDGETESRRRFDLGEAVELDELQRLLISRS